ncbi:MAG TPA: hypothetical protein PKE29_03835 [Phycisphaerales bacterium]|nr:hypothetical protein [Phycisphaerales bacterium]
MSIVPDTNIGKITFYEAHIGPWTSTPTQIGLVAADCTALQALITNARKAWDAQQAASEAAKAATTAMHNAVRAMHTLGAVDLAKIKAYADVTNDPNVYAKAQIPMPATPAPVGPPGTPFDFTVSLEQTGAVTLKWKCNNPSGAAGTVYEVRRRLSATGTFDYVGSQGVKSFTDDSIPAGSTALTYQITAIRSTRRGVPAQFNVNFGMGGDGLMVATVTEATASPSMKMAA